MGKIDSRQPSLRAAFTVGSGLLRDAGIASPELDARLLLQAAVQLTPEAYIRDSEALLGEAEAARFAGFIERRCVHEPVSRILGEREFYGRAFTLGPAALDPRPDSEVLIDAALRLRPAGRALRVLDLGTGSGCLLLTLLAELPEARGVGVDIAPDAVKIAQLNAEALGLADRANFVCGAWFAPIEGRFDIVVANPPYIPSAAIDDLAPEVRFYDPRLALDGGEDGLCAYRQIAGGLLRHLAPGGVAVIEIGEGQAEPVRDVLRECGLSAAEEPVWRDLAGMPRCLAFRGPAAVRRS